MEFHIKTLNDIDSVAEDFLKYAGNHKLFALHGAMGVGKTTFVKSIAKALNIKDEVNSPTFAIVNEYGTEEGKIIYHFDFYRVKDIYEALDFGCEEYFSSNNLCFMEWSEIVQDIIPEETIDCYFTENKDGSRTINVNM